VLNPNRNFFVDSGHCDPFPAAALPVIAIGFMRAIVRVAGENFGLHRGHLITSRRTNSVQDVGCPSKLRLINNKCMVRKGGLEPPCLLGATPSRWCVCQFHHFRAPDQQESVFQAESRGPSSIAKTKGPAKPLMRSVRELSGGCRGIGACADLQHRVWHNDTAIRGPIDSSDWEPSAQCSNSIRKRPGA
jgi:hypothetical protein